MQDMKKWEKDLMEAMTDPFYNGTTNSDCPVCPKCGKKMHFVGSDKTGELAAGEGYWICNNCGFRITEDTLHEDYERILEEEERKEIEEESERIDDGETNVMCWTVRSYGKAGEENVRYSCKCPYCGEKLDQSVYGASVDKSGGWTLDECQCDNCSRYFTLHFNIPAE